MTDEEDGHPPDFDGSHLDPTTSPGSESAGWWLDDAVDEWDDVQADQLGLDDRALQIPDSAIDERAEAARRKAVQTHDFRSSLFRTVRGTLIGVLASAVLVTVLYLVSEWNEIDPTVVISFNAAVVVNCIGLVYIIAKYLFPEGGADD